jgi:signal transduction histidine kinase
MMLRSATGRLIAIHLIMVAVSTAIVLAFVYVSTKRVIDSEVRQVVEAEIRGLADDYATHGVAGLATAIERRLAGPGARDSVYLLADSQGRRIAGNLAGWPPVVTPGQGWVQLELFRLDRDRPASISAASFLLEGGERLLVGRDSQARSTFDRTLVKALIWALGVSALLALISGWLLSRFVDRRIGDVAGTAEEIMQGAMARRVPIRGTGDEFDRLAGTLNRMLDRIETLVGDLRMVTDSVAHDLRSPLTRLCARLEDSLDERVAPADQRRLIEEALAEADGVLRTFASLLEIARAEAGVGRDQFEKVDLGRLAADMIDLYTPAAEEKDISLALAGEGATVTGHPQLLANAVANLVENAIRHTPESGHVTLTATNGPTGPEISVEDDGPGVPEEDRGRILQRFTRLDDSRGLPGAGLGLSLVAAVVRMHGARLTLSDAGPGLRVTIGFAIDATPGQITPNSSSLNRVDTVGE